jgi:hypothetical protein
MRSQLNARTLDSRSVSLPEDDLRYQVRVRGKRYRISATRLIALATSVVWLAFAVRAISRAASPLDWRTVPGSITASHIEHVFVGTHVGRYQNWPVYEWRFFVTYQYTVEGKTYEGTRIDATTKLGHKYLLTGERRYPIGGAVLVHYRPQNPADSVLELAVPWPWILSLCGAVALGWLSLASRTFYRSRRSAKPVLA